MRLWEGKVESASEEREEDGQGGRGRATFSDSPCGAREVSTTCSSSGGSFSLYGLL